MIQYILSLIVSQVLAYIKDSSADATPDEVLAGNIGLSSILGNSGNVSYMNDKVVVSVVNIMEEATMKNGTPYRPASLNPEVENPPVYVNLFLLFTANYQALDADSYNKGLTRLSQVVEFFQGKSSITIQNSPMGNLLPEAINTVNPVSPELQDICINMEMVSMTFEQINYLWGSLGGKQLPFVLYKAHVIPIKRTNLLGRGSFIQDIQSASLHFLPSAS